MAERTLQKRIRIFAGPNGSGKSTLYHKIKEEFNLRFGYYLNADELHEQLIKNGFIDLEKFELKTDLGSIKSYFFKSGWDKYVKERDYTGKMKISGNIISIQKSKIQPYDSAILADYIRYKFIEAGLTFTFETVMSHPSKIEFISKAAGSGYKIYLYFISTDDFSINQNRVKLRVKKGGHNVSAAKVRSRYYNTMLQLKAASLLCYRTYVFDNSTDLELILSINPKKEITFQKNVIPAWVNKYLINKKAQ